MEAWQTDIARRDKKTPDVAAAAQPLEVHIRAAREKIEAEREQKPAALRAQIHELERRAEACTARHQIRQGLDLREEIAKRSREVEEIESGARLAEYDESVRPFVEAYAKKQHDDERRARSHDLAAAPDLMTLVQSNSSRQSAIVGEYLAELCHEAPKMIIEKKDVCPSCSEPMVLIAAKSIMTCGVCGISSSYLDSTTNSISYGDEVEFASFSYKRTRALPPSAARFPPPSPRASLSPRALPPHPRGGRRDQPLQRASFSSFTPSPTARTLAADPKCLPAPGGWRRPRPRRRRRSRTRSSRRSWRSCTGNA
jgi:ribosomal protein S27AE